jgi:hypothetical protein
MNDGLEGFGRKLVQHLLGSAHYGAALLYILLACIPGSIPGHYKKK